MKGVEGFQIAIGECFSAVCIMFTRTQASALNNKEETKRINIFA